MTATIPLPRRTAAAIRRLLGSAVKPPFLEATHPRQRAFIDDPARVKVALCGRRAGKTWGLGVWLVMGMLASPGERSVYVAVSASKARQILWDGALARMRQAFGLPLTLTSRTGQLMVEYPNGSSIWLAGCANKSEIDKFHGERYRRVVIDEAQAYPAFLQQLVEDALEPTLADLRGELALTGTPAASFAPDDYFYQASTGLIPGISPHHWTVRDNAYFYDPEEYLREKRLRSGWDESHPTYRRAWLGEWIQDRDALIYPFSHELNAWTPHMPDDETGEPSDAPYGLPRGEYQYGLGVDLGFSENSTAYCLVANRKGTGKLYVISASTRSRQVPTAVAAHVQGMRERMKQETNGAGLRVVVDEGALGKGYAEQMRVMGVACEAAQKTEKRAYQELVRGYVLQGSIKVHYGACTGLLEEARALQFDPETGLEDDNYTRHLCDALLYVARAMVPTYKPEQAEPTPGSPEAIKLEMKLVKEAEIKKREKARRYRYG